MEYSNGTKYNKFFVAFLDILGFKEMVSDAQNEALVMNILDKVTNIRDVRNALHKEILSCDDLNIVEEENRAIDNVNINVMSDSIVVSVVSEIPFALKALIKFCRYLQCELLKFDTPVLLRGAIDCGDFFRDDSRAFGKAMVDAYVAQENCSKYPRIIIKGNLVNSSPEKEDIIKMLYNDKTDNYFYIDSLKKYFFEKKQDDLEFDRLQKYINCHLDGYESQSLREKYIWLKKDLNRVKEIIKYKETREDPSKSWIDLDSGDVIDEKSLDFN